jgi:hypothetical protein
MLASTLGTSAWCFMRFFASADELMLAQPIYGFSGVFFTVLMLARLQKKGTPIFASFPQVTYNNLCFLVLTTQVLFWVLKLRMFTQDIPFAIISIGFSWSYLRFFFRNEEGQIGDQSDDFAFVNMFPIVLHPVVVPLSTAFYNIFALTGLFPPIEVESKKSSHHLRYFFFLYFYIILIFCFVLSDQVRVMI